MQRRSATFGKTTLAENWGRIALHAHAFTYENTSWTRQSIFNRSSQDPKECVEFAEAMHMPVESAGSAVKSQIPLRSDSRRKNTRYGLHDAGGFRSTSVWERIGLQVILVVQPVVN
jgi:hypothetical protein